LKKVLQEGKIYVILWLKTIPRCYIFEFVNFNDMSKRCRKEVLAGWFIKILN